MSNIMGQISQQFGVVNPGGQAVNQSLSDFFRSLGYSPDPSEGMGKLVSFYEEYSMVITSV